MREQSMWVSGFPRAGNVPWGRQREREERKWRAVQGSDCTGGPWNLSGEMRAQGSWWKAKNSDVYGFEVPTGGGRGISWSENPTLKTGPGERLKEWDAWNQDFQGGTVTGFARTLGHNLEKVAEEKRDELKWPRGKWVVMILTDGSTHLMSSLLWAAMVWLRTRFASSMLVQSRYKIQRWRPSHMNECFKRHLNFLSKLFN